MDCILIFDPTERLSNIERKLKQRFKSDIFILQDFERACDILDSEDLRLIIGDYSELNPSALKLFSHFESINSERATFIMLDQQSVLPGFFHEKMILLRGDAVETLIPEIDFMGLK